MSVDSTGDFKQMYNCLSNELLPVAVLIQSLCFCSFVPLVYMSVDSTGDFKQMYNCLSNELLPVAVLIQSLFFGLLFLWSIRECVRLVILNKCTNDWQMNYCPLLS